MTRESIIKNKKAHFNYEFIETYVAGIVLRGNEVKSIRNGECNINESYCIFAGKNNQEIYLNNAYISPIKSDWTSDNKNGLRLRKLLLNRKEIRKIQKYSSMPGLTVIPIKIFFQNNLAKCEIAVCRGKHDYDKRENIKKRDSEREMKSNY